MYLREAEYSRKAIYEYPYDHIKQHFNIDWLQRGRGRDPGASTDSKNNNLTHHYKY